MAMLVITRGCIYIVYTHHKLLVVLSVFNLVPFFSARPFRQEPEKPREAPQITRCVGFTGGVVG